MHPRYVYIERHDEIFELSILLHPALENYPQWVKKSSHIFSSFERNRLCSRVATLISRFLACSLFLVERVVVIMSNSKRALSSSRTWSFLKQTQYSPLKYLLNFCWLRRDIYVCLILDCNIKYISIFRIRISIEKFFYHSHTFILRCFDLGIHEKASPSSTLLIRNFSE